MADAPKLTKAHLTNVSGGPKVLNASPSILLQPGESTDGPVEISEPELEAALLSEWFAEAKKADKATAPTK